MAKTLCRFSGIVAILLVALLAILVGTLSHHHRELDWEGQILPLARRYAGSHNTTQQQQPLHGKVVVITGCTGGIGLALTRALSRLGATVIGIGRSAQRLATVQQELLLSARQFHAVRADFKNLASVSAAANQIAQNWSRIDMLINNAGIHDGFNTYTVSEQGFDGVFAVNYLSHVLLTEKLAAPLHNATKPTVLQVSSSFHWYVDGTDLQTTATSTASPDSSMPVAARVGGSTGFYVFRSNRSYANSKLAQIYHARALKRRHPLLSSAKVRLVSVCPAWVGTQIGGKSGSLMHLLLQRGGFPVDGWGIASSLVGLLDYPDYGTTGSDYYINSDFFRVMAAILGGQPMPPWFYSMGFRDIEVFGLAMMAFFFQRLSPNASPEISSRESYNERISDSLYDWSYRAIQEFL